MDYKTLGLILGFVALFIMVIVLITQKSKKSIKASKTLAVIAIALIAFGGIPFLGFGNYGSGQVNLGGQTLAVGDQPDTGVTGDVVSSNVDVYGCDLSATVTYTLAAQDFYNGTAAGGTHRYRLNNGAWQTVSDAGTISASPKQKLDVLWENGATTGYFSYYESYTTPCSVTTFSPKLYTNGTLTSVVKDDSGTVIAVATNNQTLNAGDVVTGEVTLKGTFERAFPYGFDAVVEWNNTDLDDVKLLDSAGNEYSLGTEPQSHTDVYGGAAIDTKKTYSLPGLFTTNNLVYQVLMDADDTNNPAAQGSCGNNITITYYSKNLYVDDNAGGLAAGPSSQDEDQTLTRAAGAGTSVICYD